MATPLLNMADLPEAVLERIWTREGRIGRLFRVDASSLASSEPGHARSRNFFQPRGSHPVRPGDSDHPLRPLIEIATTLPSQESRRHFSDEELREIIMSLPSRSRRRPVPREIRLEETGRSERRRFTVKEREKKAADAEDFLKILADRYFKRNPKGSAGDVVPTWYGYFCKWKTFYAAYREYTAELLNDKLAMDMYWVAAECDRDFEVLLPDRFDGSGVEREAVEMCRDFQRIISLLRKKHMG